MLIGRVVPFGDHHFWEEILVLKGSTLHSLYKKAGGIAGRRAKKGEGRGFSRHLHLILGFTLSCPDQLLPCSSDCTEYLGVQWGSYLGNKPFAT